MTGTREGHQPDPLAAIGYELVRAARNRRTAGLRRRRLAVTAVTAVSLLATTTGALALTNTSTGVPAIDGWLDFAIEHSPKPENGSSPSDGTQTPYPDIRPMDGTVSAPFEVPLGGAEHGTAVGYISHDGSACTAFALPDSPPNRKAPPVGGSSCVGVAVLADDLATDPARVAGESGLMAVQPNRSGKAIVSGFARGNVDRLIVVGPSGRQDEAALSAAWRPEPWAHGQLRAFIAVVDVDPRADPKSRHSSAVTQLKVRLADGQVLTIRP